MDSNADERTFGFHCLARNCHMSSEMYSKMAWNREGTGAECWGDRFCCGANYWMDWGAALKIRKSEAEEPKQYLWKEGGAFPKLTTTFSPLLLIASYSLLRNMRDALKETTLISCMHVIHSTLHPGFYLNRRIICWNSKLSNLFNSDELI